MTARVSFLQHLRSLKPISSATGLSCNDWGCHESSWFSQCSTPTTTGFSLSAMDELGDCARGVVVIDPEASDEEIAALDRRGVRGFVPSCSVAVHTHGTTCRL